MSSKSTIMNAGEKVLGMARRDNVEIPTNEWRFYEVWHNVTLQHWPIGNSILNAIIQDKLEIDMHHGQAWISLLQADVRDVQTKNIGYNVFLDFTIFQLYTFSIKDGVPCMCLLGTSVETLSDEIKSKLQQCQQGSPNGLYGDTSLENWLLNRFHLLEIKGKHVSDLQLYHIDWREAGLISTDVHFRQDDGSGFVPALQHYCEKIEVIWWPKFWLPN